MLLLDEPFSLLDALTRMELQDELHRLWEAERKTVLMVTHDVDEALLLADRIVMMTNGPAATIGRIFDVPFPAPEVVTTSWRAPITSGCGIPSSLSWKNRRMRPREAAAPRTSTTGRPCVRTAAWAAACSCKSATGA